eukprot:120565-Pelagomonas_calceolata.AAC.7
MQTIAATGVCANVLPADEAARFCAALVRAPPLPRGRFDALVGDLSAVLRGEAAADVVMAYEMQLLGSVCGNERRETMLDGIIAFEM